MVTIETTELKNEWLSSITNPKRHNIQSKISILHEDIHRLYLTQNLSINETAILLNVNSYSLAIYIKNSGLAKASPTAKKLIGRTLKEETKLLISKKVKELYRSGHYNQFAPKVMSDESRKKMSLARLGRFGKEQHWNWKGGISPRDISSNRYKLWRLSVFERDEYTCQKCQHHNSPGNRKTLNAHHIVPWSRCVEKRYDISNGLTLCQSCHFAIHTNEYWKQNGGVLK